MRFAVIPAVPPPENQFQHSCKTIVSRSLPRQSCGLSSSTRSARRCANASTIAPLPYVRLRIGWMISCVVTPPPPPAPPDKSRTTHPATRQAHRHTPRKPQAPRQTHPQGSGRSRRTPEPQDPGPPSGCDSHPPYQPTPATAAAESYPRCCAPHAPSQSAGTPSPTAHRSPTLPPATDRPEAVSSPAEASSSQPHRPLLRAPRKNFPTANRSTRSHTDRHPSDPCQDPRNAPAASPPPDQ